MAENYTDYYHQQLEVGKQFQDFVAEVLFKELGIPIASYSSKRYQATRGENMQGIEIKRDDKFQQTGNLYIEVAEKSHPSNRTYALSGIHRSDNTWLYVIGDEKKFYIFAKSLLQNLHRAKLFREVQTPTSKGFLLPISSAEKYCAKKITMKTD